MGMLPLDDFHVGEGPPKDVFADRLKTVGDIGQTMFASIASAYLVEFRSL
jgi:hypothetical protein